MSRRTKKPVSLQPVMEKENEYSITDTMSLQVQMPGGVQAKVGRGGLTIAGEGDPQPTSDGGRSAPPTKTTGKKKSDKDPKQPEQLLEQPAKVSYKFEDLKIGEVIGEGSQAKVRRVKHEPTNKLFALKIISFGAGMTRKVLQTELFRCSTLDKHPNLVSSLEAYFKEGFLMVLMEFMAYGTLQGVTKKVVEKGGRIPEDVLSKIAYQILAGLNHLHTGGGSGNGLIHRDLKPSNVLVNSEGQVKISDFGVATFLSSHNQMAFTSVGSTAYMSPERVRGDGYTTASDIWAVGVSLAEIAIGYFPIGAADQKGGKNEEIFGLCVIIAENRSAVLWPEGVYFSDEFKDFVSQCMQQKPEDRPTAAELMSHPFIKKYENTDVDLAAWFKSVVGEKEKRRPPPPKKDDKKEDDPKPAEVPAE